MESDIKYEGFIIKQNEEILKQKKYEKMKISSKISYDQITGLSNETREKLKKYKPLSIGQASRIQGITPADITVLIIYLVKNDNSTVSRETIGIQE